MKENKEEYIPRCPHCNDDARQLNAYVLEENKYTVELVEYRKRSPALDYGPSDVMEGTMVRTVFSCRNCGEMIFTVRGDDSEPPVVLDFFKGVGMTWVQDIGVKGMVPETLSDHLRVAMEHFNKRSGPEGSYYAEGFPRKAGVIGIYFVDPTSSVPGMTPVEGLFACDSLCIRFMEKECMIGDNKMCIYPDRYREVGDVADALNDAQLEG